MKIANSVFLVTGGASGLGAATARMVVEGGGRVVLADLNEEAGKVFRFKEQEKLHEEVIDSGLAKIYQSHLDISREIAQAEQTDVKT
ncbi:MAG TPA: SDR family NAD(P)-dependent oxidoreductase, partial [Thauera aminoaromatica]|nr:SDR family NAD(P)-dependent oxidoreductase [Thauera aminoaromatica]